MARQAKGVVEPANDNGTIEAHADCADEIALREVGALDFPGQFLVWGIRSWVQAFKTKDAFEAVTQDAFVRFGLIASAAALDGVMTTLAASAARPIDVRCAQCRYLSPDESLLLDAVGQVQAERFFNATVALRKLMPGTAARLALSHVVELARDMARAGMILRGPSAAGLGSAADERDALPARHRLH